MPPRARGTFGQARGRLEVGGERKMEKVAKERKHLTTVDALCLNAP